MKLTGELWTNKDGQLILLQEGVAIDVMETIRRLDLWGKTVTITTIEGDKEV